MRPDPERLWRKVALGEDPGMQLREVRFHGEQVVAPCRDWLADEMAALANAGGGRILLGVTEDREPQGLSPPRLDALMRLASEAAFESVTPALDCELSRVPVPGPDVRGALLIEVREGFALHQSPGGHFQRWGRWRRPMAPFAIRRLRRALACADPAAPDRQIVRGTGIASLASRLWRRFTRSRAEDPPAVALSRLRFVREDANRTLRATVAGVLLAAEDSREWIPQAWVQAVCYRGTRMDSVYQLDAEDIHGPLDEQIRQAVRFVIRNNRVASTRDAPRTNGSRFRDRAVFEALVNAVVHRDYTVPGSHIRLFRFDDRLELYSPGGLCNSMTPDDLRTSQFRRNALLATRLGECVIGDVAGGSGRTYFIERRRKRHSVIQDETLALAGRPAVFEVLGGREVRVVLPAAGPRLAGALARSGERNSLFMHSSRCPERLPRRGFGRCSAYRPSSTIAWTGAHETDERAVRTGREHRNRSGGSGCERQSNLRRWRASVAGDPASP